MSRLYWAASSLVLILFFSCQTSSDKLELARDYYNIGNAYSDLKEYEKAAEYYKRALVLDPDVNQAAFNLAKTSIETGEFSRAVRLLSSLEEQDGSNLMVLEMLGYAWYQSGDGEKASLYYLKCLEIDPAHLRSLYNMSVLSRQNEQWSESRGYLERLLDLEEKKEYRVLLAELLQDQGDAEAALVNYESLVEEYGGDAGSYLAMKNLYLETERYYKALDMIDLLIESEGKEQKADLFFEKSALELDALDDPISSQGDLKSALDAGFGDEEALESLLERVDPVYRSDFRTLIEGYSFEKEEDSPESDVPFEGNGDELLIDKEARDKAVLEAGN